MCLPFNTLNFSVISWRVMFVKLGTWGESVYREEDFSPKILPHLSHSFIRYTSSCGGIEPSTLAVIGTVYIGKWTHTITVKNNNCHMYIQQSIYDEHTIVNVTFNSSLVLTHGWWVVSIGAWSVVRYRLRMQLYTTLTWYSPGAYEPGEWGQKF